MIIATYTDNCGNDLYVKATTIELAVMELDNMLAEELEFDDIEFFDASPLRAKRHITYTAEFC